MVRAFPPRRHHVNASLRLPSPPRLLSAGATFWFVTATLGQLAFVVFIAAFFGGALATGDLAGLNAKPHVTGYVPGDIVGNTQFLGHAVLAGLVTFAGLWQLVPALRRRWPAVHRWNGRLFLGVALVVTLTGFWLVWVRGSRLGTGSDLSISLNGLLILCFAVLAWRSALRRDVATHRRHALRAWLLVNGVWFLRIGIMLAGLVLTPLGIKIDYQGATFILVSVGSWVVPLAVLELYFRAERSPHAWVKTAMGTALGLLAFATLAGSLAAAAFMWWPVL
nr:DUF2306 domain-containing protein [Pseudoxanthomonas sp. PXM01]